ncbi:ABC transporter ATP-binding protein [bacterium]|nr:ABC transporter ATP-binding protein [bacterium]
MLEINNISKSYGNLKILDSLDLKLNDGEIYSLLGENGSGKTTILNLLTGLLIPDNDGIIKINGLGIKDNEVNYKKSFGYVQATPFFYEELTIKEFLLFIATLYDIDLDETRFENLVKIFEIDGDLFIGNLSFGQKQKVAIISALIHRPRLLILDEPTIGLDPISLKFFKNLILSLKSFGVTIIFATHILEIAANLSDRIGILKDGKIYAEGTFEELSAMTGSKHQTLEEIFIKLTGGDKYRKLLKTLEELEKNEKNYYSDIY